MSVLEIPRLRLVLFTAAGLRSFGAGLTGVLLGLYLGQLGVDALTLGFIVGAGLAGMALATAAAAFVGERVGRRRMLIATAVLSAGGLVGVALGGSATVLMLVAFLGMVNGMGRDRSAAQTLEQSLLADAVADTERTRVFTRYTLVQDISGALGSLGAAAPSLAQRTLGVPLLTGARWTLVAAAAAVLVPAVLYSVLPRAAADRARERDGPWWNVPLSPPARRRVGGLAGLFALDSLGGGFLAGSIITYWFFRQFGLAGDVLGPVFFAARGLNALSYLAAEWLATRIGLIRTMVFTHLPSSAVLCALPFLPSAPWAIGLFLAREALVQMDVPTRQSYVAAVTAPGERTFALGATGLVRNAGWAFGPPLGGLAMSAVGIGAPLVIGAGLKIVYDLALYRSFRHLRPPEETGC